MKSALIISTEANLIIDKLPRTGTTRIFTTDEKRLHRAWECETFDVYIVDSPPGESTAVSLAERDCGQVVFLAEEERFYLASDQLAEHGIITVPKPLDDRALLTALRTAEVAGNRYNRVVRENQRLVRELEDMKVINRAKLVLVTRLSMTEPEAHRYIEKQAMDMRSAKRAVAESILKTYEY